MKKILIVDDDEQIIEALNLVLKKANYETILRNNAKDIIQFIKDNKPDIILMDIRLIDGNGLSITKQIKQDILIKHIPVVLISARVGTLTREELSGAEAYLPKPFRMKILLDTLSALIHTGSDANP